MMWHLKLLKLILYHIDQTYVLVYNINMPKFTNKVIDFTTMLKKGDYRD